MAYGANAVCSNTNCFDNKTDYYKTKCDSQKNCTINTDGFVDPCFYTYKYIEVFWECTSGFIIYH